MAFWHRLSARSKNSEIKESPEEKLQDTAQWKVEDLEFSEASSRLSDAQVPLESSRPLDAPVDSEGRSFSVTQKDHRPQQAASMAPQGFSPETGGGDPGSTMAFLAAFEKSRASQKTAATPSADVLRAQQSQQIDEAVPDPFDPGVALPYTPSAPAPSPYIPKIPEPSSDQLRERRFVSPSSTGVFMAAFDSSRSWKPKKPGAQHFLEKTAEFQEDPTDRPAHASRQWDELLAQEAAEKPEPSQPVIGAHWKEPAREQWAESDGEALSLSLEGSEVVPTSETSSSMNSASGVAARNLDEHVEIDQSVGRSAAMMSILVIVSRLTGFLRTWAQAYALGLTAVASTYTVANNLPNQLYELVMGGMLITAFLPVYLSVKRKLGREGANRYVSNLTSLVCILMGAITVIGWVFAYQVVLTQSMGAAEGFDHGEATMFFRFFAIEIVLYALSSIISGILNAERHYFWSTAAPIFNNFICMASFFGYAWLLPANPSAAVMVLAVGNPLGVFIQVAMQVPSLHKLGVRIRPYVDLHDAAIKETLSIGVPSIVVTIVSFVTVSVQSSCALQVTAEGSAVMYYARLWYTLPYAILAIPITTAMFTELSEAFSSNDMEGFKAGITAGTNRILFFLVPFMLYLIVFSPELMVILGAGKFSQEGLHLMGSYLVSLSLSLPLYGVCTYLQKVCSSYRKLTIFAWASIVAGVLQVLICVIFTPIFGIDVVALSSLAFYIAVDLVAFIQLRAGLGQLGLRSVVKASLHSLVAGAAGALVGFGIVWALGAIGFGPTGFMRSVALCIAGGIPALLVTYGMALVLKWPEAQFLRALTARIRR